MVAQQSPDSHHSNVKYEMQYSEAQEAGLKISAVEKFTLFPLEFSIQFEAEYHLMERGINKLVLLVFKLVNATH